MFSEKIYNPNAKTKHLKDSFSIKSFKTLSSEQTSSKANEGNVIIAISEGRGLAKGEIGISCIDITSPMMRLSQFPDCQTYGKLLTKINALGPTEILLPNTSCGEGSQSQRSRLFELLTENFPDINIISVQRKYFNDLKGLEYIKNLCIVDYSKCIVELTSKYYCLISCAALLKYIEYVKHIIFAPSSVPIIYYGAENTTLIDITTCKYLELMSNLKNPKSTDTLFHALNYTKTRSGIRMLKANVLQPPCDLETIECRLETVEFLIKNENLLYGLNNVLAQFIDVEHLLSLCIQMDKQETSKSAESKILQTLYLKHTLDLIQPLREILKESPSKLMKIYFENLDDARFDKIKSEIDKIIDENAKYQKGMLSMRIQKCCALKRNLNGLLDLTRKKFAETTDDISEYAKQMQERMQLQVKLLYNSSKGYYLQINSKQVSGINLPNDLILLNRTKNSVLFTSNYLMNLNDRINETLSDIYLISNGLLNDLFLAIRKDFGCLYKLIECISLLDMLQSFATYSNTSNEFVRPAFGECLAIDESIHPILSKSSGEPVVANKIYASDETSFTIITGSNMSGKSTYLRQIATLQIIAQLGCFVPASHAQFRLTYQIFSRLGTDDDIEINSSSFEKEMIEMKYIVDNCNKNSLILIDELCRSTSHDEGLAITLAFCEHLITKSSSFVFFATHFSELTQLDSIFSNAINYHFESELDTSSCDRIAHNFTLRKGPCELLNYGLLSARTSNLPSNLIDTASSLVKSIGNTYTLGNDDLRQAQKRRCVLKLVSELIKCGKYNNLDDENLESYLNQKKQEFEEDYQSYLN